MKYGVRLPNSGPFASREAIKKMATAAERLGYDAVMVHDHVSWGYKDRYHFYAGSKEAQDAKGGPPPFYEVISTLSYLAGVTKRVWLVPDALCLAWRPVLILAREALTLHQLSEGRFALCVCLGDGREGDYAVTNTPWNERGRIVEEKLQVLRMAIDKGGPMSFQGQYVSFQNAELHPQPVGLPLWYAGASDIAVKRAGRYCDGWMPPATPAFIKSKLPELYETAEKAGRGHVSFEVITSGYTCLASTDEKAWDISRETLKAHGESEWVKVVTDSTPNLQVVRPLVGSPQTTAEIVRKYQDAGVTLFRLGFIGHTLNSLLEQMEMFAKEVRPLVN